MYTYNGLKAAHGSVRRESSSPQSTRLSQGMETGLLRPTQRRNLVCVFSKPAMSIVLSVYSAPCRHSPRAAQHTNRPKHSCSQHVRAEIVNSWWPLACQRPNHLLSSRSQPANLRCSSLLLKDSAT